jgi:cell wall-associated NlpC family hydrolase
MVRKIIPAVAFVLLLSSCSTFKPLNFTSNKQVSSSSLAPGSSAKFIDNISVTPQVTAAPSSVSKQEVKETTRGLNIVETPAPKQEMSEIEAILANGSRALTKNVESASSVQLKYAVLMNTEVENLPSTELLKTVDEWYGVRYRTGGNSKSGVDCSGFTVAVYAALYGISLPRVSRDQYRISQKLSITELQEGDLVFFNTNGSGVSHVGIYLGNSKFIHASVSRGIMVNGLYETYYSKRYYGAGRIENKPMVSTN